MSGAQSVRSLTADEVAAFRVARLVAAEQVPYFMHALFAVSPLAAPGIGTYGVDGQWRLYMDPALLVGPDRWEPVLSAAVLTHEVGHLIREHAPRFDVLPGPGDRLAFNLAGDAEINDDLLAAGIVLPDGAVTPEALGLPSGRTAEEYYEALRSASTAGPLPDDGSGGCGSGAGSGALPGEVPEGVELIDGAGAPVCAAEGDMVRRRVARAVEDHLAAKGRGSVPAGLARWASSVLAGPVVRWDRVLRAAIRRALADRAGRVDYSYRRPSRRRVPGIVKPSMRAPRVGVAVVIDTSGSMGSGDLDAALSEVDGVLRASGVARDRVRVLSCDAAAARAQRVRSGSAVQLTGGGGTDMRIGIAAAEALRPRPEVVVVLTDGVTPWPDRPTRARLVCGIISAAPPRGTPPWAVTVPIPPAGSAGRVTP